MKRINIQSSSIVSIGYDIENEVLQVEFTRGAIYNYDEVKPKHFCDLLFAESIGSHFSKKIAKMYNFEKVEN
ncbi:MAG: KTSC domain-containing protein [Candidatus Heimdallarchaeota archaeon]